MPKTNTQDAAKTETVPYDVAQQLRTPEEMAAYLDAWLAEAAEDAAGITRALGDIARAKGMTQVARDTGLSRESLYKALSENGGRALQRSSKWHTLQACGCTRKRLEAAGKR